LQPLAYYSEQEDRTIDGNTIYPNNYKYSNLRAWMNGLDGTTYNVDNYTNKGFLDIAFSETDLTKIKTTTVDNSAATTGKDTNEYACENTEDKIFALSYSEVQNLSADIIKATVTDYARATGAYCHSSCGSWWLRSSGYDRDYYARYGYIDGFVYYSYVGYADIGVRPAMHIIID